MVLERLGSIRGAGSRAVVARPGCGRWEALEIDPVRDYDCTKGVSKNSSRDGSCFFSKV